MRQPDFSESFYRQHARRYAEVSQQALQSIYVSSSHPKLTGDHDLINHLKNIAPGKRGLDAGCGAEGRDVYTLLMDGFDIYGIDATEESVHTAVACHPEVAGRVAVADLRKRLGWPSGSFDFVLCDGVIQHMEPRVVRSVTLPEFHRLLRPGGILQLMFKNGRGVATVYDRDYGVERTFQLYDEREVLAWLRELGFELLEAQGEELGGVMYFSDPKPMEHCVFYVRKTEPS